MDRSAAKTPVVHAFHMELERIFGDFDARPPIYPPTYLIHFKWKFDVDISTPFFQTWVTLERHEIRQKSEDHIDRSVEDQAIFLMHLSLRFKVTEV